ncbi:MAG TPA: LysR family transcriptional regulator [Ruminiclostridium sp.]|nr:LysR family transcriptional regulator [Ruminiclostridium sp.]
MSNNTLFINADEVAEELGVSKPYAYKLVKRLNEELREKGFLVISGRVSRQYFMEKVYGSAVILGKGE